MTYCFLICIWFYFKFDSFSTIMQIMAEISIRPLSKGRGEDLEPILADMGVEVGYTHTKTNNHSQYGQFGVSN